MGTVRFERVNALGRIVLTDPPFNFVGAQYTGDLTQAVHDAADSDIRALLIESEGPNFSVGGAAHEWPDKSDRWFQTFVREVTAAYRAIEALSVPVVCAIRGEATGGGLELALSSDFIIASDNAMLWCLEINAGQIPLAGGFQRLLHLVGPVRARRMVMLGQPTPVTSIPEVAEAIVADSELDTVARELATRLSGGPSRGYAAAKAMFKAWSSGGISGADKLMLDLTAELCSSEDSRYAIAAAATMYLARIRGEAPSADATSLPITYTGR